MRIALVSPYSWSYPGGVTRHIEALAEQFIADGHYVRVLAPFDPPGRLSTGLHRGAQPAAVKAPYFLISLGRTIGFKANGSVSNLSVTAYGVATLQRELRTGGYDVVHIHEPIAPVTGWVAADWTRLPLVGTFHSYSAKWIPNAFATAIGVRRVLNRLHVRIAVSEAAAWTGKRWYGGHYRVIPNGVHVDHDLAVRGAQLEAQRACGDPLRIVFVGQAVERKGLPLLLRAFEALREQVPCELTVIGPSEAELSPLMVDPRSVRMLGKVDDETKTRELQKADVLAAPSLGGESFGMVLTEAFAAGTPVVASDIAGYRDVVRDGHDGVLVPAGDAQALAEALRDLYDEPERRAKLALNAVGDVERFAWPRVAAEVMQAYEDAIATPEAVGTASRAAVRLGLRAADLKPHSPARRIPSLERREPVSGTRKVFAIVRRVAMLAILLAGIVVGFLALRHIGFGKIGNALINSKPSLVLLGLAVMCSAMAMRAVSWKSILQVAMPKTRIRMADSMQGIFIGVLMSSTLPARLGEPARALVVARRTGRPRENLPIVLGTLVSQTLMNFLALAILGIVMFSSVNLFSGHQNVLLVAAIAPVALLLVVLATPIILRFGGGSRSSKMVAAVASMRRAVVRVRAGLVIFKHPKQGLIATVAQLAAWALQWMSCFILIEALGLGLGNGSALAAAAAVLFAVNITAVLPATPANLGVFQAACATVLHSGYHVAYVDGVAYGVILQAVEVTTAVLMGMPALVKEGMSWKEVRLRTLHSTPVKLPPRPSRGRPGPGSPSPFER
ncbi:MAG: glycosyltransferase [Solirubrobacteraceae bacterium]